MKKKGLIISTVVMVVVLIAALTTATFAWFSSTTMAQIDTITMQATSAAKLKIGVISDKETGLPASLTEFLSGDISWATDDWDGAPGMGPLVTFDESLTFTPTGKAVGLASKQFTGKTSAQINKGTFYTGGANSGSDKLNEEEAELAKKQTDYLDVKLGIMPVADKEVKQAYLHVTVEATDPVKIGMAAAIHFAFRLQNTNVAPTETLIDPSTFKQYTASQTANWGDEGVGIFDAFAGKSYASGWSEEVTYGKYTAEGTKWEMWIEILQYSAAGYSNAYTQANTNNNIAYLEIMAWLDGDDNSCVTANTGTGGRISFEFVSYDKEYEQKGDIKGVEPTEKGAGA